MDEAKRSARRKLLAEIKGPWDSDRLEAAMSAPLQAPTPEVQAAVDAAAAARFDDELPAPISVPTMDQLDSAWEDEDDAADDEDDEREEASEPELPDEGLDPLAYAEAKRAREERAEARRERRRAKVEAKKARRKARADAAKGKQKGKTKKARAAPAPAKAAPAKPRAAEPSDDAIERDDEVSEASVAAPPMRMKVRGAMRRMPQGAWMLALVLAVLLAAAIAAAVIFR